MLVSVLKNASVFFDAKTYIFLVDTEIEGAEARVQFIVFDSRTNQLVCAIPFKSLEEAYKHFSEIFEKDVKAEWGEPCLPDIDYVKVLESSTLTK